jgi:hypothetical protein
MVSVNCSSIRAVGYNGYTLAVQFYSSNSIYDYHGVPYSVYMAFMNAASMDAYHNQHVRGRDK